MTEENKSFISINFGNKPKWLSKKLFVAILFVVAAGAGCYLWGSWSVDTKTVINEYLASEPQTMIKGRQAGYAVNLVGNETISQNWISFCDAVVQDCANILEGDIQ